jgi:hypothetical protein
VTGQSVTFSVTATDDSGGALVYAWDDGGAGGTFTGSGSSVSWTIDTAGTYTITVTVTDAAGNVSTATFDITVEEGTPPPPPPENQDPVFESDMTKDVSAPVATQRIRFISEPATDPDGDTIVYTWSASGAGTFTDEAEGEEGLEAYWAADAPGNYTVTLTADDGKGGTATQEVTFDVAELPTEFTVVGYETCGLCHTSLVTEWQTTAHSMAFETNINPNPHGFRNEACYNCHAAGQFPAGDGGFIDQELTPQFANIQCESCHGPGNPPGMGAGHKPIPWDPGMGYQRDAEGNYVMDGETYLYDEAYDGSQGYGCGLCHEGARHGAFEEWAKSVHATFALTEDDGGTPVVGPAGEANCVSCHNGEWYVRIQIDGEDPPAEDFLPEDANESWHITCATCHDPHNNQYEAQLRVDSEADITLPFDDTVVNGGRGNICLTCHNGRRTRANMEATITATGSSARGIHGNAQGAMLYGISGFQFDGYTYETEHPHQTWNDNSCVTCHMFREPYQDSANPAKWGHEFEPRMETCLECHVGDEASMETYLDDFQAEIQALVTQFETKWPAAWKTVDPDTGAVSITNRDTDPPTGVGPPRDDPDYGNIYRQCWWNYYYVTHDLSMGAHNPAYARDLMESSLEQLAILNAMPAP